MTWVLFAGCDLFSLPERDWADSGGGGIQVGDEDTAVEDTGSGPGGDGGDGGDAGSGDGGDGGGPGGDGGGPGGDGGDGGDTAWVSWWWSGGAYVTSSSFEGYSWLSLYGSRDGDLLCELRFYASSNSPASGCSACDFAFDLAWDETEQKAGGCEPYGVGPDTTLDWGVGFEAGAADNYWGDGDGVLWYAVGGAWYPSYFGVPYWTEKGRVDLFQWWEYYKVSYYYE